MLDFIRNADVLILDPQFDADEYKTHTGWGHGCLDATVALALKAGVPASLPVPSRPRPRRQKNDGFVERARQIVAKAKSKMRSTPRARGWCTITSPPSALISGGTFTITYSGTAGGSLLETYVNNSNGTTYSFGASVHNVTQFSATPLSGNPKAYQIALNAGSTAPVQRTFVAFGRNL